MTGRKYDTDQNLIRKDGIEAWSPVGRALADARLTSAGGRVKKLIGKNPPFSKPFIKALEDDHDWIQERTHIVSELRAAKRIMNALQKVPNDRKAQEILQKMQADPTKRDEDCFTCPFWRNYRELSMMDAARKRYVFPRVRSELYLVTIIFSFAENLMELSDAYQDAHRTLKEVVAELSNKRRGVMITGSFEPDLVSADALTNNPSKAAMMRQLGRSIPDSGGWILTGHFIVRVPHDDVLRNALRSRFMGTGWSPVEFDTISGNGRLEAHLLAILGYAGKYPKPLFDVSTRGPERREADARMNAMRAAFSGPNLDIDSMDDDSFNIEAAIVQWAKFIDGMDEKTIYYSVESVHAQKWYSDSELAWIRLTDFDMYSDGKHRIEMHRDTGPFSERQRDPKLKGRFKSLRSRPLVRDTEWEKMTDCSGADPMFFTHDFRKWMLK
jgi:hypothetical protein